MSDGYEPRSEYRSGFRPFSAFLVIGKEGKVGFEFAPREPRKPKAGPAPSTSRVGSDPVPKTGA